MHSRTGHAQRVIAACALVLAGVIGNPQEARADVRTDARGHFRNGMALIQEGRLDQGVQELETAYDLLPHPNVLYNIARAYAEAGQYERAIEFYERYLDTDPPDREEVDLFVKALDQRLAQRKDERTVEVRKPAAIPVAPTTTAGASPEEIQALEDSATQIATLAEATQSEALRQRAERLRALAQQLREGPAGQPGQVATAVEPVPDGEPTGTAQPGVPEKLELGKEGGRGDLYEEQVVSASRFAQSPLDAPNSTATITRQDIRLSGLTQIGELLRRVAGADVMTLSPGDVQSSIRGFNDRLSQRMLILVDGRSTYLDYLGSTFLTRLPFNVEDIERIEVIRGPASALYGANAFSGVVNIITREPGEDETTALGGVGNGGQAHGQLAASGRIQRKLAYRVAAGYNRADMFESNYNPRRTDLVRLVDDPDKSYENSHMNASLRYRLLKNLQATASGGIARNYSAYATRGPRDPFAATGTTSHVMALLESNWGQIRSFWNRATEDGILTNVPKGTDDFLSRSISNVFDVDATLSRAFNLGFEHNFHLGANYRQKRISWNYLDQDHTENHYAVYIQDTMTVTDWLTVVGSFRADFHPLLDSPPKSARGAVIVKPTPNQAVRMSAGTAFRTPTFVESYFQFRNSTAPALFVESRGFENAGDSISPEKIFSAELGYMNTESSIFKAEANAYYNRITDIILPAGAQAVTLGSYLDPSLHGYTPADNGFPLARGTQTNQDKRYDVVGGELMGTLYPVTGVDVYANYAFTHVSGLGTDPTLRSSLPLLSPTSHKVNMGAQYRAPFGVDLSADLHVVSTQTWSVSAVDFLSNVPTDVPAYYMLNARVGYRILKDQVEFGLSGYNITNNHFRQHPFGQNLAARYMATVALRL